MPEVSIKTLVPPISLSPYITGIDALLDCLFTKIPRSVSSKSMVPKSGTSGFCDLLNNHPVANIPKVTIWIKTLPLNILTALNTG